MDINIATTANAHDLFGSYVPILDTLCKGLTCDLKFDVWKGFALSQILMFKEKNMYGLGVSYLFGTTPFAMMCLQGELAVNIDERSLEILKLKPTGQRLCIMPAQFIMSDEAYLLRILEVKGENDEIGKDMGIDGLIALIWRTVGEDLKCDILAGPFSITTNIKTKNCSLKDLIKLLA